MKKIICLMAIVIAFAPISLSAQEKEGFIINGTVQGIKDGTIIEMAILDADTLMGTCPLKDGKFQLSGFVPEGPRMIFISFPVMGTFSKNLRLLVDNGQNITVDCGDIFKIDHGFIENHVTVNGCPTNAALHYLIPVGTMYIQSIERLNNLLRKVKDSIGFDANLVSGIEQAKDEVNQAIYFNFFRDREDSNFRPATPSQAIPYFIMASCHIDIGSRHAPLLMQAYEQLRPEEKNTFYGKKLYEAAKLSQGQPFPMFTLATAEGKPLSLQDIVAKGKVTIVHFWNEKSWNRKVVDDELRFFYKKYHDKGLNIVGFSSDKSESEWKSFLQKEQFPWYNVSDLKGKEGLAEKEYHIKGTTNVLLDEHGKILAWNADGAELQWYLWKAFETPSKQSKLPNQSKLDKKLD